LSALTTDETLLRQLLAEVRSIKLILAGTPAAKTNKRQPAIRASQRDALESLLPVLAEAMGGASFTVRDLEQYAASHPFLSNALDRLFGTDDARNKRLGHALRRVADAEVDIASLRVMRLGGVREGVLWTLKRVAEEAATR
jgi:hypothetical protein